MAVETKGSAYNPREGLLAGLIRLLDVAPPKIVVPLLVLTAIFVRLIFVLATRGIDDPNSMDAQNYLSLARNLAEGRGFVMWNKPSVFVAPLYPAVLAGLRLVFGDSVWVIKTFQAIVGGVSVWLMYLLGREFFHQRVAYGAAAFFAFHPEMIAISAFIYTEVIFIFLLLLTLLVIVKAMQTGKRSSFLLAGVFLGVTNLCRGTLMYFPIFLFSMWFFYRHQLRRHWLSNVFILTVAMALTMLPWAVRNYVQVHAIVPVATGGGDVFWTGNYLPFDGEFRYEETQKKIQELVGNVSLIERDRILMTEAKKNIAAQPLASAWLFVRKIFRYWFRVYENIPQGQSRKTNWLILGVLGSTHFVLLALAAVGVWRTELRNPIFGILLMLLLYYTLIHAATLAVPRYRQPLIPVLCLFAASGLLATRDTRHVTSKASTSMPLT